ncbi:MAG: hypothetical protein PHO86_00765 [Bacilli bacterium]|nr:hypothetical protein [Bacilli bacterium]
MEDIIIRYYLRFPLSTIQDLIKLLYQATFGGGHMISDPQQCLAFLHEECSSLEKKRKGELLYEYISPDIVRVNLRPYLEYNFNLDYLNDAFIQTSNNNHGDIESFKQNISLLKGLIKEKLIALDLKETLNSIDNYEKSDYPVLHHSNIYRESYQPAYRIIDKKYLTTEMKKVQISTFISSIPSSNKRTIIAIEGKSCSGKSFLAEYLKNTINAAVISTDDFFLNEELKLVQTGIGDFIDYKLLENEVLSKIKNNSSVIYHKYNCQSGNYESKTTKLSQLILVEGVYSYNKYLAKYYDYLVYVDVSKEEQMKRLYQRNSGPIIDKFINEWIPKENLYFKTFNIKGIADVII